MEPNRVTSANQDEWPYSPKFQEFANFLGLPATKDAKGVNWRYDKKTAEKIEELFAWGKDKSGSEDIVDVMLAVRALQRDLGVNWKGKTLVDHLWGFIKLDTKNAGLDKEKLRVEKEMELYKNPPQQEQPENLSTEV